MPSFTNSESEYYRVSKKILEENDLGKKVQMEHILYYDKPRVTFLEPISIGWNDNYPNSSSLVVSVAITNKPNLNSGVEKKYKPIVSAEYGKAIGVTDKIHILDMDINGLNNDWLFKGLENYFNAP